VTLPQGTVQFLAMYFTNAAGNVQMALYDSAGNLLAKTIAVAIPQRGFVTLPINTAVAAGSYRLMEQTLA